MRTYKKMTFVGLQEYINENGMTPVKNVPGVNEHNTSWYINQNGEYLHIVKIADKSNKKNKHFDVMVNMMKINPNSHVKDRYIRISMEGTKLLHRILAATFLAMPYDSKLDVHHKDFNRNHNTVDNLEVLTHGDHMRKHFKHNKANL